MSHKRQGRRAPLGPYYAYRAAALAASALPRPLAAATARGLGLIFAIAMRGRRATVARHLQRAHGATLQGSTLRPEVQRAFDSYARYWVELFRLPSMRPDEIERTMSYEGLEHLIDALAAGAGAIMVMPHLGGWEVGATSLALQGHKLTTVVEPIEPTELFEWFVSFRQSLGLTIVPLGPHAGTAVLRALRAGEVVGLLCDRDIEGGGVEVEFFGERTTLPAGPATLALRTGAPILPCAVYFEDHGGHHGVIQPPIPVERTGPGRIRHDITRVTQLIAYELEALIRRAPEQWHLFQPNWPSDHEATPRR